MAWVSACALMVMGVMATLPSPEAVGDWAPVSVPTRQPSPTNSRLLMTPDGPLLVGEDAASTYTADALVRDRSNRVVAGITVSFAVTWADGDSRESSSPVDPELTTLSAQECVTDSTGRCGSVVGLTSEAAGDFKLWATIADPRDQRRDADIVGSPATVTFSVGPVSSASSRLTVNPIRQVAGEEVTVTIAATDQYLNAVTGLSEQDFTLRGRSAGLTDLVFTDFHEEGAGEYSFTTTSQLAASFTVSAVVSGVAIAQTAEVEFFTDVAAPVITQPVGGSLISLDPAAISGSGLPGATVTVREDGQEICAGLVDDAGAWSCTASLSDGEHTLIASQTDLAGTTSPDSEPVTFVVQRVSPTTPTPSVPPVSPEGPMPGQLVAPTGGSVVTSSVEPLGWAAFGAMIKALVGR
ncbi:MAG: Ig-like domain-containing protein [Propionibacteriaceae bacterium]|jgi:hypothetical protein|nr:Ig-like domain-containing protein [Propionibacteriaceae bacterium]